MARFIGFIKGNRGEASRLGTEESGLNAAARGWNCGARIRLRGMSNGGDRCTVYADQGSNGGDDQWVATIMHDQEDGYRIQANPELVKVIPHDDFKQLVKELVNIIRSNDTNGKVAEDILLHLNYVEEAGPHD